MPLPPPTAISDRSVVEFLADDRRERFSHALVEPGECKFDIPDSDYRGEIIGGSFSVNYAGYVGRNVLSTPAPLSIEPRNSDTSDGFDNANLPTRPEE